MLIKTLWGGSDKLPLDRTALKWQGKDFIPKSVLTVSVFKLPEWPSLAFWIQRSKWLLGTPRSHLDRGSQGRGGRFKDHFFWACSQTRINSCNMRPPGVVDLHSHLGRSGRKLIWQLATHLNEGHVQILCLFIQGHSAWKWMRPKEESRAQRAWGGGVGRQGEGGGL